jgi:predicted transcriptional regulator of viral defense system
MGRPRRAPIIDIVNPIHSGRMDLHLESGDFKVRFVKVAGRLVFGYLRVLRQGAAANVADKEKAVIDTLLLPGYAPLDEAAACIRSGIDLKRAMEYARRTGRQAVVKRLGYLLTKFAGTPRASALGGTGRGELCETPPASAGGGIASAGLRPDGPMAGRLSGTYVPLDPSGPRRGAFDREWRVIVNRVIE